MKVISIVMLLIISFNCTSKSSNFDTSFCDSDCVYEYQRFRSLAQKDSGLAEYMQGLMLITGQGTDKNIDSGVRFIKRAAQKHEPSAQYQLGYFYLYGIYFEPNLEKAKKLLTMANKHNIKIAKKHLEVINKIEKAPLIKNINTKVKPLTTNNKQPTIKEDLSDLKFETITVTYTPNYSDIIYAAEQQICKNGWGKMDCKTFSNSALIPLFKSEQQENSVLSLYL
ncbi:hypothetical protein [uncultured Psychrosphaera sp.]|uniref:tetratricopeptide repeat protein n=1 Tax=uncultured Psychrosphaera sp. TaxID=1403522 RepID=UPI002610B4E6|nr:hypothetical protein [uncultured Psychrosphaera sp.]